MKALTLRTLQEPFRLLMLLESLVTTQSLVPSGVPQIVHQSDLSAALQKLALKAAQTEGTWLAWRAHNGVQFFTLEACLELSRERRRPAFKATCYNEQGTLEYYGHWLQRPEGTWQRCTCSPEQTNRHQS